MHGWDAAAASLHKSTRLSGSRSRAGSRSRLAGSLVTRPVLATFTAVRGSVTTWKASVSTQVYCMHTGELTVTVHAAARALSPVTADRVAEFRAAASINSGNAGRLGVDNARGLTKNWLTSACD